MTDKTTDKSSTPRNILENIDLELFHNSNVVDEHEKPMFSPESLRSITNIPAMLIRIFVITKRIGQVAFNKRFRSYANYRKMNSTDANTARGNLKRAFTQPKDTMTWGAFENFINTMGYDILNTTVVMRHRETGEIVQISSSDKEKIISDYAEQVNQQSSDHEDESDEDDDGIEVL